MTKTEAIEYGLRWKDAICDRGDTELSDAIQFLNMAIQALEQEPSCRNTRQVDLISRQDAIDALDDIRYTDRQDWWAVLSTVENLPPATKPKRGKWVKKEHLVPLARDAEPLDWEKYDEKTQSELEEYWHCSECDYEADRHFRPSWNYCPNCGADMRGDEQ